MTPNRRNFLTATGSAFAALAASGCASPPPRASGYSPVGDLVPDPAGLLDLPPGFSYRVVSRLGDAMDDGGTVPDRADGMGCFDLGNGKIALVRNHELKVDHDGAGASGPAFDTLAKSLIPLPGGTTNLVLDAQTLAVEKQFRSFAGTIRNCAGGVTPWGTWLTCEEDVTTPDGKANQSHGWVFEVPANATGQVNPPPLKAMGRFKHEAACVDPATGIVYLTEDRGDSLLYRFIPNVQGQLAEGGTLQVLIIDGLADTRNWSGKTVSTGEWLAGTWRTIDNPEAPDDDLRERGAAMGASLFARGEGIWMGDGEFYFTCTSGGVAKQGQIFRIRPNADGPANGPDAVQLFYESPAKAEYTYGDNLVVAPNGHLVVCEDSYDDVVDNHLRGVTPQGSVYPLARLRVQTEPAGACFSPDGRTMFVNAYSPTMTFAIQGPWLA